MGYVAWLWPLLQHSDWVPITLLILLIVAVGARAWVEYVKSHSAMSAQIVTNRIPAGPY